MPLCYSVVFGNGRETASDTAGEVAVTVGEEQDRRLSALLGIMGVLGASASIDEVLFAVAEEVVAATGATACNSFLMCDPDGHLFYRIVGPEHPTNWSVPSPPDALAVEVLRTGLPIAVADCAADPRCDQASQRRFGICSALAFPLVHTGKTLAAGCCIFTEPHRCTEDEIAVVMAIAGVAAMAVAHSRVDAENLRLAVAEERNRLSQELHDSLCQSLAATKIQLNLLMREPGVPAAARAHAQEAIALVEDAYADARDVVHSFRMAASAEESFLPMLDAYVRDFSTRTGIRVLWDIQESHLAELSPDATLQLSRVIGEALSNVRKHAQAGRVALTSTVADDTVSVSVEDDGVGFDAGEVPGESQGHFGLRVMAERAALAGGALRVEGVPTGGTRVTLLVPRGSR